MAGSGLMAPVVWICSKLAGAKCAVYLHGMDIGYRGYAYRLLWRPFIRGMDFVIANSSATEKLAIEAGVDSAKIRVVFPGVCIPERLPTSRRMMELRRELELSDKKVLLSVGRLTERKGLREFVDEVLPKIVAADADIVLLVVGDAPDESIGIEVQTVDSIKVVASKRDVDANLKFLGVIKDRQRIKELFRLADVHVFPVRSIPGNTEGFGMVAIEAAAMGTPTVAYETGGIVDSVDDGVSGKLVGPGNSNTFAMAVTQLLEHPLSETELSSHAEKFSWHRFGECLLHALCLR